MIPQPLHLFSPHWLEPLDVRTQVDRLPPVDAPCMCEDEDTVRRYAREGCGFPFCPWKPPESEDE